MKIRKTHFLALFFLITVHGLTAQIKGDIQLKADGSGDYPGLQQAFDALSAQGIDGGVTISLAPGTYPGILEIGPIPGTSPTRRVTLTSSTGKAGDVLLEATITAGGFFFFNLGHILIRYTDYLTISHLTIRTTLEIPLASTFTFFGGTHGIEIRNCKIYGEGVTSFGLFSPKYTDNDFESSGGSPDSLLIDGNYIEGDLSLSDYDEGSRTRNLVISNNDILTRYISLSGLENVHILNNRIKSLPEESGTALLLFGTHGENIVSGNYFDNAYTSVTASFIKGSLKIYNNFIINSFLGIDLSSDKVEVYFNNFYMRGNDSEKTAIHVSAGENNIIKNNNFVIEGSGSAITFPYHPSEDSNIFDYNNYYSPSGTLWRNLGAFPPQGFSQLEQIRQDFGAEINGLNVNPGYFSEDDLHVSNSDLKGKGIAIPGIETDYDGDERHPERPDIGADEAVITPNLTLDTVRISPQSAKGRALITVTWRASNSGGRDFESGWKDYIYLSEDNQLDGNDIKLGEWVQDKSLNVGASYEASFETEIERETDAQLYFIVVINADGKLSEAQSDNLGIAGPLSYLSRDKPSLYVTEIIVPEEFPTGTPVNIRWVVSNKGDLPTSAQWEDNVYISADTVLLQDPSGRAFRESLVARVKNVSGLGINESYVSSFSWTAPITGSGKYYVRVIPDGNNKIDERNEDPLSRSVLSRAMNMYQSPVADLVVTSVSIPATAFSGDEIDIAYTVKNIGNAPTIRDRRTDNLFLLNDSTGTENPARNHISSLRLDHNQEILPDSSVRIMTRYRLPSCTSGKFFLDIHIDTNQQVDELSDDNNRFMSSEIEVVLRPGPDFVIEQIAINPSSPVSGSRFTLNYRVKNEGFDAARVYVNLAEGIWLSRHAVLDEKTALLALKPLDPDSLTLVPGEFISRSRLIQLPDSAAGLFYLYVNADNGQSFCEYPYEGNNLKRHGPFNISRSPGKDLQITGVEAPATAEAGAQISLSWNLENKGPGAVVSVEIKDSLALFNAQDTVHLHAFRKTRDLPGNSSVRERADITIPHKTPPGNYTLALFTDLEDRVYEHEAEHNNVTYVQNLTITRNPDSLPDLVISDVGTSALTTGQPLQVTYKVTNTSAREVSGHWADKLTITDLNGAVLLERTTPVSQQLGRNRNYTNTISIDIPVRMAGSFRLRVEADAGNSVKEFNDENNLHERTIDFAVTRWADLAAGEFIHPDTLTAGQEARFSWRTVNTGTRETEKAQWTDRIYLSDADQAGWNRRELLKRIQSGSLAPGSHYMADTTFRVPLHLSGAFYLGVSVDDRNDIFENNAEENNLAGNVQPIFIRRPAPADLQPEVKAFSGDGSAIRYTIHNRGANPVRGSWQDALYLSSDPIVDRNDLLIGYQSVSPATELPPGGALEVVYDKELPAVKPGHYFLLVRADLFNYIAETDISNNTAASAIPVYIDNIPDLTLEVVHDSIFRQTSRSSYYQLEKPAGKSILLTMEAEGTNTATDLFYRTGELPVSGGPFDHRGHQPMQTNQRIIVPSTDTLTTDFILAEAKYLDRSVIGYSLLAEAKDFSLLDVQPRQGGKHGIVVVDIEGFDFSDSLTIMLRNGTEQLRAVHSLRISPTLARAHLNLNDIDPGVYDVVLKRNDRGDEAVLQGAFTVEEETWQDLHVEVVTPSDVRIHRDGFVQVNWANRGNINEYDISLYVSFFRSGYRSDSIEVIYMGDGVSHRLPAEASLYSLPGEESMLVDEKGWHLIAWMPVLPARGRGQLSFRVRGATEDTIFAEARFFRNNITPVHFSGNLDDLKYTQFMRDLDLRLRGELPADNPLLLKSTANECIHDPKVVEAMIWKGVRGHAEYITGGIPSNPAQVVTTLVTEGLKSFVDPEAHNRADGLAKDLTDSRRDIVLDPTQKSAYDHLLNNLDNCLTPEVTNNLYSRCIVQVREHYERENGTMGFRVVNRFNCPPDPKPNGGGGGSGGSGGGLWRVLFPKDPNDIIGPEGLGSPRFVNYEETLPYKIRFENISTATAAALRVDISNVLEEGFDIRRFRLDKVGWGDTVIQLPEVSYYSGEFELGPRYKNHRLKLVAGVDPLNRRAFWNFVTIDPLTGATPDESDAGFLPPNDSTGIGEGFVSYVIRSLGDLAVGSTLENSAVIVFDEEESLSTNIWMNTLAGKGGNSFVNELPAETEEEQFRVSWDFVSSEDFAPVPVSYAIMVSVNGGPYEKWLGPTTETSAMFMGSEGNTYRFFSIAGFSNGTLEREPSKEDALTTVVKLNTSVRLPEVMSDGLTVYPNPSDNQLTVGYSLLEGSYISLELYDFTGRKVHTLESGRKPAGAHHFRLDDTGFLRSGVYFVRLTGSGGVSSVKWVKQ
jgi:subtilase family serine protease